MPYLKKIVFLLLMFGYVSSLKATHIVGGEIYYKELSGNDYEITLKLYRDCINGVAGFDSPASIGVYDATGNLIQNLSVYYTGPNTLQQNPSSTCGIVINSVCVEEAIYTATVNLPPITGGYDIVYQRCCRNNSILNLANPGSTGSTYKAHVPGPEVVTTNSSPFYNNFPPIYLCINTPINFDHSATDLDGDSLVYELCDPYDGASSSAPMPSPPAPPPYATVNYNTGFTSAYPLTSNPAIYIDQQTGFLSGVPTQLGQFVVGVCVSEYRNGTLISVNKRDFQFNVLQCANPIATIPFANVQLNNNGDPILCNGYTVQFNNNSVNANSYYWDFGDPTTTSDNSSLASPTYTYPDSGAYTVSLVAYNNASQCYDTAEVTIHVYPDLSPLVSIVTDSIQCFTGNSFNFSVGGSYSTDATFLWSFQNANTASGSQPAVNNVSFNSSGNFYAFLNVAQYGCIARDSFEVQILDEPTVSISPQAIFCNGLSISPTASATNTTSYSWNFGDPASTSDTSGLLAPTYTYSDTGIYTISLTVSNLGRCFANNQVSYEVYPPVVAAIPTVAPQCLTGNNFSFQAAGSYTNSAIFSWQFDNATPISSTLQNPSGITFNNTNNPFAILTISQFGCTSTDTSQISILPDPVVAVNPQTQYCEGVIISPTANVQNATIYHWDFGVSAINSDTSNLVSPTYTYSDTGSYIITLTASNGYCSESHQVPFIVYPRIDAGIQPFGIECLNTNNFTFMAGGVYDANTTFSWDLNPAANVLNAYTQNVYGVSYPDDGYYPISVTFIAYGCVKTAYDTAIVLNSLVARFNPQLQQGCHPYTATFFDSTNAEVPVIYHWDFGDGSSSNEANPTHEYSDVGLYDVSLTVISTQGCIDTSVFRISQMINVHEDPVPGFSIDSSFTGTTLPSYIFHNTSPDGLSCSYNMGDGQTIDSCDFEHIYSSGGIFTIRQTVTNKFGCRASIEKIIYTQYNCYIPNTFTPNDDGRNDFFMPVLYGAKEMDLIIFNRWGEEIFHSQNLSEGWDGTYHNKICQQEVYTYVLNVKDVFEQRHKYIGTVTLIK